MLLGCALPVFFWFVDSGNRPAEPRETFDHLGVTAPSTVSDLALLEGNPGVPGLPPVPEANGLSDRTAGGAGTAPSNGYGSAPLRHRVPVDSVLGDPDAVREGDRIALPAPAERRLEGTVESISRTVGGRTVFRGRIDEEPFGHFVTSIAPDGRQVASIHLEEEGTEYFVRFDPYSGQHLLQVLDLANLPEEGPCETCMGLEMRLPAGFQSDPVADEPVFESLASGDGETSGDLTVIDVMVVYTPAAGTWAANGAGGIEAVIFDAMARAQLAMDNSEGLVEFRLVHTAPVDYVETGDALVDLQRLTWTENEWAGYLDEVHVWRDEHRADLVALFVEGVDYGGIAWIPATAGGDARIGFSISSASQAGGPYFTHAHEMGHNMGLAHDMENSEGGPGVFDYSYGWRWEGTDGRNYRSIMAYAPGTRAPHFSNPDIEYVGVPTGVAEEADNARTIREMRHIIGAYRDAGEGLIADRAALVAFYHATGGENWHQNAGWLDPETPVADWYGVTVSGGRVTELNLPGNNLTGSLPPELGEMVRLVRLRLGGNQLTGAIPPELGNMYSLWTLRLEENNLSGTIPPELGGMVSLLDLWLDGNNLTGELPSELGDIAFLQALFVNGNDLSGSLPHSLTQLSLSFFWFDDTDLCEPQDEAFQAWLATIDNLQRSGIVCPDPPTLQMVIEPGGAVSGEPLATQPVLAIRDAAGNVIDSDHETEVSVEIVSGAGGVLSGTLTLTVSGGVAEFTDLVLFGLTGESYGLRFTTQPDQGVVDATELAVAAGAIDTGPGGTWLSAGPSAVRADGSSAAELSVQLRDSMGNEITVAGVEVRFLTSLGMLSDENPVTTDNSGRASVNLTSLEAGEADLGAEVYVEDEWRAISAGNPASVVFELWQAVVLELSGSTGPLQAGETRVFQATFKDVEGETVSAGADAERLVTFSQTAGDGEVIGLGAVTAFDGVAQLTLAGGTENGPVSLEASATSVSRAFLADDLSFEVVTRMVADGEVAEVNSLSYQDGEITLSEGGVLVVEHLEVAEGGTLLLTGEGILRVGQLVLGANAWLVTEGSIEVVEFLDPGAGSLLSAGGRLTIGEAAAGEGSQVTLEAGSLEIVAGGHFRLRHGSLLLGGNGLVSEIAGRLELFHCLGSIEFNGDVEISGNVLGLISDFHLAPGVEVSVLSGGELTFDGCLVDAPGEGFSLGVTSGGAFTMARSVFENGAIEIDSGSVSIRDNLFFGSSVLVGAGGDGAALYHNIVDDLAAFLDEGTADVITQVDGWGNVESRNATQNDLVLELRASGLESGRTLDAEGNLFIQPGDSIAMDIEAASLARAVDGGELLLGYADDYFVDPVLLPGADWQLDVSGASGEAGVGRVFASVSHTLTAGTDADGPLARLGLTSTELEGRTLVFFRVRQPIDIADGFSETALRDTDTEGWVTPFTMNTGYVTIDGTPPRIADGGSVEQDQDGLRDMTSSGEVVEQGALIVSFEAHDSLAGIDDAGVGVTLLGLEDLTGESVDGVLVDSSQTFPIGEEVYTRYVFEVPVTEQTLNGAYLVQATVADRSGNTTTTGLGEVTVNKNEIDVDIALQGFTAGSDSSPLVVDVTFVFTDAAGTELEERVVPVALGSANLDVFTFKQVPEGTVNLSAKAPKHLRRRLPAGMDENGQGAVLFTGVNRLLGGDLNGDNRIRAADLGILSLYWFQSVDTNPEAAQADITGDGRVRSAELAILQTNWFLQGDPR